MKRTLLAVVVTLACFALAQGKYEKVLTGGSGKKSPAASPVVDAGVVAAKVDAGTPEPLRVPAPATTVELERAKKEIAELRVKVTELEARVSKTEALTKDVEALRAKAEKLEARLDAEEERRESEAREVERRKSVAAQNQQLLNGALSQLSTGNTSNVDAWLRNVEANSSANTQKLVQLARQALAQQDLVAVRQYLALALMEP